MAEGKKRLTPISEATSRLEKQISDLLMNHLRPGSSQTGGKTPGDHILSALQMTCKSLHSPPDIRTRWPTSTSRRPEAAPPSHTPILLSHAVQSTLVNLSEDWTLSRSVTIRHGQMAHRKHLSQSSPGLYLSTQALLLQTMTTFC